VRHHRITSHRSGGANWIFNYPNRIGGVEIGAQSRRANRFNDTRDLTGQVVEVVSKAIRIP